MTAILVVVGAALGAPARWYVDQFVTARRASAFPWGTFVINVSGSLVLGVVLAFAVYGTAGAQLIAFAGTGVCGAYTTFSTFGFETIRLSERGLHREAVLNVAASVVVGLAAAILGWYLGEAIAR